MFCVCSTDPPLRISFKVKDDEFEEMSVREGFQPAPYMARAKWVLVDKPEKLTKKEWEEFIKQSYELVKEKLPKKVRESLSRK
jgi:predicted DNA-binding protein (MmcQ/YjbR family)